MVKQVVIEEADARYLKELSGNQSCTTGLIIGQTTNSKDYVAKLARCPTQFLGDDTKQLKHIRDVDGLWVAGHASQVLPSLPGGISVVGLFLVAKSAETKPAMEKLKQILYQTYKLVAKLSEEIKTLLGILPGVDDSSLFWTAMHIDSESGTVVNCRQYDVKDNKDSGRPVEVKQTDTPIQWDSIETILHIDDSLSLPNHKHSQNLFKAMQPFCYRIGSAHCIIDGANRPSTEVLNHLSSFQSGKLTKKKKGRAKTPAAQSYSCKLFLPIYSDHCPVSENNDMSHEAYVVLVGGSISGKAYLPPGCTVAEATYALKYDILQSIQQRSSVLTEDENDSEKIQNLVKLFPRRVYANDGQKENSILFSEYVLPGEPIEDCLERFTDNLDINVESEQLLETNCIEKFGGSQNAPYSDSEKYETDGADIPVNSASKANAVIAVVATAVAAIAWMFSGLFISEN